MHTRLLSFISDIERALATDDPTPSEGAWENSRTVNYNLGLARLVIEVKLADGKKEARGSILIQSYLFADESTCLKAVLAWTGSDAKITHPIYSKPDINWTSEARKVAAEWLAGPPAKISNTEAEHEEVDSPVAATG